MFLVERYEPYLIGTQHIEPKASQVIEHIFRLKVKSVGVEVSKWQFYNRRLEPLVLSFWKKIVDECGRRGIRVVFLTPDSMSKKIVAKQKKFKSKIDLAIELANPKTKGVFSALVKDSMTRAMEKQMLKEKPEAIISGGFHALLMKKDLKIPSKKFLLLGQFSDLRRQEEGVRIFRLKRRIRKGFRRVVNKTKRKFTRKK